jgi:alpha-L-fucosidase
MPWSAVDIGLKRDLVGKRAKACRADGRRFGVTFDHEYSLWWWQTALDSATDGGRKGSPYDGALAR